MKSRLLFLLCAAAVLLGVAWCSQERELPVSTADFPDLDSVTLCIATDLHVLAPELMDRGAYFQQVVTNADGKMTVYSEELLKAFIHQVIQESPEALILSGDLTFNGEAASHRYLSEALQEIQSAGIPVFVLPGNHDLDNPMAAQFIGEGWRPVESITADEFAEIYCDFGYGAALARDDDSLSYTAELASNLRLLVVDVNAADPTGTVSAETLAWVEAQLRDAVEDHAWVIAVSHQNLLIHNSLFTQGFVMGNANQLLHLYEHYPVICNLGGHIHLQHTAESFGGVWEIVTSSLAVQPNQYGVINLAHRSVSYRTECVDVSSWAAEQGSQDPSLLDFSDISWQFFRDTGYRQAIASLGNDTEAVALADFFGTINAAYFAGRMDTATWDAALFDGWQAQGGFFAQYLVSIADDGFQNHTKLEFSFGGDTDEPQ